MKLFNLIIVIEFVDGGSPFAGGRILIMCRAFDDRCMIDAGPTSCFECFSFKEIYASSNIDAAFVFLVEY